VHDDENAPNETQATTQDDDAVSPVIGVVLMAAITVILAAVIGTFAVGLFDRETNPAPSVSFDYDYDESANELTITHASGSEFERTNVEFVRERGSDPTVAEQWPTEVTGGDRTVLDGIQPGDEIRIVWQDPWARDTSAVIGRWEGSDA
jgi:FlaG/FlaF family flagellin (archaellin)